MKTEAEVREAIEIVNKDYKHVLTGSFSTIDENAPRALMQLAAETRMDVLHWLIGEKYVSKLVRK